MSSDGAGCVLLCSCPKCEQRRVAERGTELNRSQNEEDAGLELDKTSFLVMGISADALNAADTIVKAGKPFPLAPCLRLAPYSAFHRRGV